MRSVRIFLPFVVSASLTFASAAQQATTTTTDATQTVATSSPQAVQLLQSALAALNGNTTVTDVTLNGTVRRVAGSDDESGTVTFKALAGTGSRLDLTLPGGNRTEVRNTSGGNLAGSSSDADGVIYPLAYHNLMTDTGLFPAFTVGGFANSSKAILTNLGSELKNGAFVTHLSGYEEPDGLTGDAAILPRHLSQMDMFLDASTNLPVAFDFNTHDEDNALLDISVEIRFSDYRPVNGAQIPFHIQKFLNNSLLLDIQFQTVALNSGLDAASFSL